MDIDWKGGGVAGLEWWLREAWQRFATEVLDTENCAPKCNSNCNDSVPVLSQHELMTFE